VVLLASVLGLEVSLQWEFVLVLHRPARADSTSCQSNRPTIICQHLGGMVTLSVAFTSHHLSCGLANSRKGWLRAARLCHASFIFDGGLRSPSPLKNSVSATCPVDETLFTWGTLLMSVNSILPHLKSTLAPNRFLKSVPSRPGVLAGSEYTRKECVNSLPFSRKVTDCCPLISRMSPITPYGSSVVTCTLLLDMSGCIIDS